MASTFSNLAAGLEPRRPGQGNSISRALFTDGRLWLLSDAGGLTSITPGSDSRVDAGPPEPTLDICISYGHIKALTCSDPNCTTWAIRTWDNGQWPIADTIHAGRDKLVALTCNKDGDSILTTRRIIGLRDGKHSAVLLSKHLDPHGVTTVLATDTHMFVGINAGEWGGGLRRIDRVTGRVSVLERNTTGSLCGGPLNADCDPVNGIIISPWKPECAVAAIGLVHLMSHGRIVEVCGSEVRRTYFRALPTGDRQTTLKRGDEPPETVPFFGLARVEDSVLAVGIDGIYRFKGRSAPTILPLPAFQSIGNVAVSFDLPEVVLILSSINQGQSLSGDVPLIVPR